MNHLKIFCSSFCWIALFSSAAVFFILIQDSDNYQRTINLQTGLDSPLDRYELDPNDMAILDRKRKIAISIWNHFSADSNFEANLETAISNDSYLLTYNNLSIANTIQTLTVLVYSQILLFVLLLSLPYNRYKYSKASKFPVRLIPIFSSLSLWFYLNGMVSASANFDGEFTNIFPDYVQASLLAEITLTVILYFSYIFSLLLFPIMVIFSNSIKVSALLGVIAIAFMARTILP